MAPWAESLIESMLYIFWDLHLKTSPLSPCIDQVSAGGLAEKDIDGDGRPLGASYDIGADEAQ